MYLKVGRGAIFSMEAKVRIATYTGWAMARMLFRKGFDAPSTDKLVFDIDISADDVVLYIG